MKIRVRKINAVFINILTLGTFGNTILAIPSAISFHDRYGRFSCSSWRSTMEQYYIRTDGFFDASGTYCMVQWQPNGNTFYCWRKTTLVHSIYITDHSVHLAHSKYEHLWPLLVLSFLGKAICAWMFCISTSQEKKKSRKCSTTWFVYRVFRWTTNQSPWTVCCQDYGLHCHLVCRKMWAIFSKSSIGLLSIAKYCSINGGTDAAGSTSW